MLDRRLAAVLPDRIMAGRSRTEILKRLARLAGTAAPGTLVETFSRCGTPSCGCHRDPERRHGPHLYIKYRSPGGRATAVYVPRRHAAQARRAVAAWAELWRMIVTLGERNLEGLRRAWRRRKGHVSR